MRLRSISTLLMFVLAAACVVATLYGIVSVARFGVIGNKGARVYYDAYHGARHLWDRDNARHRHAYNTVSGYRRFLIHLEEQGFEIYVETARGFDREVLNEYDVFVVGEETFEGKFMSERETQDLRDWVEAGGSLFLESEHTNTHFMADTFNRVVGDFPVEARRDGIVDRTQRKPFSHDWINLAPPPDEEPHPVADGVQEYLLYAGASLDSEHGILFSLESSWADKYNPNNKPLFLANGKKERGELRGPLAGVVAFEQGEGKVVGVGDHNAFSNPNFYYGDHARFATNAFDWLTPDRVNTDAYWGLGGAFLWLCTMVLWRRRVRPATLLQRGGACVAGVVAFLVWAPFEREAATEFFVHAGNASTTNFMTKVDAGHLTLYGQWTKEPQLRPWTSKQRMEPGYDALFLTAPTEPYTEDQLEIIDGYLSRGKTVVYLASIPSLESEAGQQLRHKFDFDVHINRHWILPARKGRHSYIARGPEELLNGIFRFYATKGAVPVTIEHGLDPVVHLTRGGRRVEGRVWIHRSCIYDVMSEKRVGLRGRFVMIAPLEMFNTAAFGDLYAVGDVVQEQMAEFMIRVAKDAAGDDSASPPPAL